MIDIVAKLLAINGNTGQNQMVLDVLASGLPYGADTQVIAYVAETNNIDTITFKRNDVVIATRTFSYKADGVANNDLMTGTVDT